MGLHDVIVYSTIITVIVLLIISLNYYLKEKLRNPENRNIVYPKRPPTKPLSNQFIICFLSIENIETGYLYEKFISINIPTQNHGSELNSSFIINEIKLKILSLKEEINKNTSVDINNLKVININKLN